MIQPTAWYEDASTVHSVATWAVDNGEIVGVVDLLAFFEKPYNYEEIYDWWTKDEEGR